MNENLQPDRHKQGDFFICDVFDSFKDDIASMEHPVFSLSKKPDYRMLEYSRNGNTIKIKPSYTGLATIFDKDILLYLASALVNAKNTGEDISKAVRFTTYDYIVSTNKALGGMQYKQMKEGLERLKGTVIQTNIKAGGVEITEEFGLIDSWKTIKEDSTGKVLAVEVKLSDWFYNSIVGDSVLSIDRDYFRLRKPIERRLYELARKHCGSQPVWKIGLENLKDKLGVISPLRKLRFGMKEIADENHLPEYRIELDGDVVVFTRKEPPKTLAMPEQLPKHVTNTAMNEFVRDNPTLTKGKTEAEVKAMLRKPKKTGESADKFKRAFAEAKKSLK
jgi:plasmid replication initiation protein